MHGFPAIYVGGPEQVSMPKAKTLEAEPVASLESSADSGSAPYCVAGPVLQRSLRRIGREQPRRYMTQ